VYRDHKIAVSIPAYNEEKLIAKTLLGLPDFLDIVVVVDDCSRDGTSEVVRSLNDARVILERNDPNRGVGYSVIRGFKRAMEEGADVLCIMPGDAQCDPVHLPRLIDAILDGECDYAKANRFIEGIEVMPPFRRFGNTLLTILTKFSTGYYSVFDTQNSFSAVRAETVRRLDLDNISPRYEFENSYLLHMSFIGARVKDVSIPPIYGEEKSTIKLLPFMMRTSLVLLLGFFQRIYRKYVLHNFHPIALFLYSGLLLMAWGVAFGVWAAAQSIGENVASSGTVMLSVLPFLMGFQLVLAALVLDITNEPR
jgi:glycosyltransferase involved in cell wall biosynthesis